MHDATDDANYDEDGNFAEEGFAFREVEIREQDRFLPVANIARIMKKVLPNNAKIAKDAKEGIQECLSEFISFITSEASDKCQQEKRKTINGDDLLWAMSALGFDKYIEPLKIYLAKYRESVKGEKPEKKPTIRPKDSTFPSIHAQPKTPMGGMNMMMGMGTAPVGPGPVGVMHSGADSMSEYGGYHHSYVSNPQGMQSGISMDPSMHMAQNQHRNLAARPKVEDGAIDSSTSAPQPVASYQDMNLRPTTGTGLPIQYPTHQLPYDHDQSGMRGSIGGSIGGYGGASSDSYTM